MSVASNDDHAQVPQLDASVYKYFDRHGALIYVGITKQSDRRNAQHNERAEWWRFVARQKIEHYTTREDALAREKELIRRHRPPFNKQHNVDHDDLRADYLAMTAVGTGRIKIHPKLMFDYLGGQIPIVNTDDSCREYRSSPDTWSITGYAQFKKPVEVWTPKGVQGELVGVHVLNRMLFLAMNIERTSYSRGYLQMSLFKERWKPGEKKRVGFDFEHVYLGPKHLDPRNLKDAA